MFGFSIDSLINLIPIFIVLLLLFGAIASIFINPTEFIKTRTYTFLTIMASTAVVILSFNVLMSTIMVHIQMEVNNAQFTKQAIDRLWLLPNQVLTEKTNVRPEFYASLYNNNLTLHNLVKDSKVIPTVKSELEEQYVCILLIQCWEDYLTFRKFDKTGDAVWINNFLQWAQSSHLKRQFDNLKYNFASTTRQLAGLLFEYAKRIPIPCTDPHIYEITANKMLADARLHAIFAERDKK